MIRRLVVAGACLQGPGYPNARGTLAALAADGEWCIEDHAHWLPEEMHLWRIARGPWVGRLVALAHLLGGSLWSFLRVLPKAGGGALVYAPYPAVFLLLWASLLPARWRPRIVADTYISLWDSMFRDRGAAGAEVGVASRCMKWLEGRALRAAQEVIVDTEANRAWMIEAFGLLPGRVSAMPLAIDAAPYLLVEPGRRRRAPMRVLFIGTLVPLHGIQIIADAVRLLGPEAGIEFEFIGSGQQAAVLEELEVDLDRAPMQWRRGWASPGELAEAISRADVCLGVFGGAGKASRVFPFKLYLAMASGRAIVTQAEHSLPAGLPEPPWLGINPSPGALARALLRLSEEPATRHAYDAAARDYFVRWLGADAIARRWKGLAID